MPGITTDDKGQQIADEKPKLPEQIVLEDAETAFAGKDYKTARQLLEKLVKLETKVDYEELVRIKESAILAIVRLFKETKDAKGLRKKCFLFDENLFLSLQHWQLSLKQLDHSLAL